MIDVNKQNSFGSTALMLAAWQGQDKVVELLLGSGADVQLVDNLEDTAFHHALMSSGNERTAKLLVNGGADVNRRDRFGRSPLCLAVELGYEGVVDLLLDLKADGECSRLNIPKYSASLGL